MISKPEPISQDPLHLNAASNASDQETGHSTTSNELSRLTDDDRASSPSRSTGASQTASLDASFSVTDNTPKSAPSSSPSRAGARGPIGPRPGVYRPCARCRVKKTKCDKSKPICSSCQKGGPGIACVYDNDEPSSEAGQGATPSSTPSTISKMEDIATVLETAKVAKTVASPSNTASEGNGNYRSSSQRPAKGPKSSHPSTDNTSPSLTVSATGPPQKKHKTNTAPGSGSGVSSGSGSSSMNPSPLRTSITTIKLPASKSSSSSSSGAAFTPSTNGHQTGSKRKASMSSTTSPSAARHAHTRSNSRSKADIKIEKTDLNMDEDVIVEDLAIKDKDVASDRDDTISATPDRSDTQPSSIQADASQVAASSASISGSGTANINSVVSAFRPKKHPVASISVPIGGSPGTYNYGQAKIIGELNASRPTPPFVIDKNQKARKWGRSHAVIQTLGGEVALPLWSSSQEMLLNDPRPAFVQRPIPTTIARPGTNLARLAVLRQMDNNNSNFQSSTTPERGNTPESKEGSPVPQTSNIKKKRGQRKQDGGSVNRDPSIGGALTQDKVKTKSHKRVRTESGASAGAEHGGGGGVGRGGEETAGEYSSTRSTPTPTTSFRPRIYKCSFDGCAKSFMDKFHLDKHEKRHITEEIVCGIDGCTKAYNSISTVRRHQSIVHKDKKNEVEMTRAAAPLSTKKKKSVLSHHHKTKQRMEEEEEEGEESPGPSSALSTPSTRGSSPSKDSNLTVHGHERQISHETDDVQSSAEDAIL
ncbi:hypothetical protein BG004_001730, partial [Podila humilis]